jgi:hypothetical protein
MLTPLKCYFFLLRPVLHNLMNHASTWPMVTRSARFKQLKAGLAHFFQNYTRTASHTMHVHHLPVRATFRGTTDAEENFHDQIKRPREDAPLVDGANSEGNSSTSTSGIAHPQAAPLVAHFRGRKLLGCTVTIGQTCGRSPLPYEGVVLLIAQSAVGIDEGCHAGQQHRPPRSVEIWDRFSEFTSWEHDREPTVQDTNMINAWLHLAVDIHTDVTLAATEEEP